MAKRNTNSELEHLRGLVKQLKKEVKRLQKNKDKYPDPAFDEIETNLEEELQEREKLIKNSCPKCKGKLEAIIGPKISVFLCGDCGYRSVKK